ncbi:MAG: hypothetical protein Q4A61_06820 [Porphyromonadaceae bacterium]|nr:hypothetical protein [Porphyromonadaceae bacterium]
MKLISEKQTYEPPLVQELKLRLGPSLLFDFSVEGDYVEWGDTHSEDPGGGSSAEIWAPGGRI